MRRVPVLVGCLCFVAALAFLLRDGFAGGVDKIKVCERRAPNFDQLGCRDDIFPPGIRCEVRNGETVSVTVVPASTSDWLFLLVLCAVAGGVGLVIGGVGARLLRRNGPRRPAASVASEPSEPS